MFRNSDDVRAAVLSRDPASFVSHHIFEPVPHAFAGDQTGWIDYKLRLAKLLEVDPHEIVLTGSAALGFSLNPTKGFSVYHDKSDFDLAVVSGYHFDLAWRYLRKSRVAWPDLNMDSQRAIRQHRKSYVFTGTIATNWFLHVLPFGARWQSALDEMSEIEPSKGRDVKLRIYKDYDCLRFYHTDNLRRLRDALLEGPDALDEIDIGENSLEEIR